MPIFIILVWNLLHFLWVFLFPECFIWGKVCLHFLKLIVPMFYLFLMRNIPSLTSSASVLFPFFLACFVLQLPQDPVSDPGVCVADIKAKLYLYFVLRHRQSPPLPEGKNRASSLFILSLMCYMYDSPLWKIYKNLQGNLCLWIVVFVSFWKNTSVTVFQSLKPSAHLFTQLSKVLKLSKVQEVRQLCSVH